MTIEELHEKYRNVLSNIKTNATTWVSGKGFPILKEFKSVGLVPNSPYTKDIINLMIQNNLIELDGGLSDYRYRWTGQFDVDQGAVILVTSMFPSVLYNVNDNIYLMYKNQPTLAKVVDKSLEELMVSIQTPQGLKSLIIDTEGMTAFSVSKSSEELMDKLCSQLDKC